jgi:hypothetical protein
MGNRNVRVLSLLPLLLALALGALGCGKAPTYILFAGNARDDNDVERVPSLRLPFTGQPDGARIFCEGDGTHVWALKIDDGKIRVRDPDGLERVLDLPGDGAPVGLVTFWPQGTARHCGIAPDSPVGTYAFWMWRQLLIRMRKLGEGKMLYVLGEAELVLNEPLKGEDRRLLLEETVPDRLVSTMY